MSAGVNNFVAHAEQQRPNSFQIGRVSADPKSSFASRGYRSGARDRRVYKMNLRRAAAAAIFLENDGLTELQSTQSAFGLR